MPTTSPVPEPRVAAFEDLAFGMFVHWGLYSQLGRGEWVQHAEKIPGSEYLKLMESFTAEGFSGRALARAAKRAGMNYVTLTSRHHEGFSLYDTRGLSKLDVLHTPCGRDLVSDFVEGCRAEDVVPMLYHTTLDWNEPRFEADFDGYLQYLRDSVEVLCSNYGPLGGLWFDGNWSKPGADWQEGALYEVIRRHQPDCLIINNTGTGAMGEIGHPEIDSVTFERGRPRPMDRSGARKYVASEMCHTFNYHWGVAANDFNLLSPAHVIEELCFARSAGANLLMNVGPLADGSLPKYEVASLERVGDWIELHGGRDGALYRGRPCEVASEGDDFALEMDGALYLFVTDLSATGNTHVETKPKRGPGPRRFVGVSGAVASAEWLDNGEKLEFDVDGDVLTLKATDYPYGANTVVRLARVSLQ